MCGLPVSPVPLSTFWTQSLEERVEVWERTKWTWETTRLEGSPVAQVCVNLYNMIIRAHLIVSPAKQPPRDLSLSLNECFLTHKIPIRRRVRSNE